MPQRPVNELQLKVLRWISHGCPDGVMHDSSFKTSAVALRNRGLASVTKRGGWHAAITPAGRYYLEHGNYPDAPAPQPPKPRKPRPNVSRAQEPTSRPAGDLQQPAPPPSDADVTVSPVTQTREIRVPSRVSKLHPVVAEARDKGLITVSKNVMSRSVRIAHALALACEREGWTVRSRERSLTRWGHPWSDRASFVIDTGEYRQGLYIGEENDRSEHVLTTHEQRQKDRYGYSYAPKYDYTASGRLFIEIDSHYRGRRQKWADRQRWTIEEKLGQIIDEIEARSILEHEDRLERERKEADRRERAERATAEATMLFREAYREQVFLEQVEQWHHANRVRDYLNAMASRVESMDVPDDRGRGEEWLAWCREVVGALDPLESRLAIPECPEPSDDELRRFLPDWFRRGW